MSKEPAVLSPDEIIEYGASDFNDKNLPVLIHEQVRRLKNLDQSVNKAIKAAVDAKDSAVSAKNKSAGFGKKKAAIEELQSAGIDLAEAVQSGAEAQKISFKFQTELAEISKGLFGLGISNIASNRFVVRELEMRLKGASEEELSELARQELIMVIKQLKEQEDILRKQENISKIIKNHDERLKFQIQESQQVYEQLQIQAEINKLQDIRLKIHEEDLQYQAEIINRQEEQLKIQSETIKKQDEQLVDLLEKNKHLTAQIKSNFKTIKAQKMTIDMLKDEMANLEILLNSKGNNILLKITLFIATIALVVAVIPFFF